MKANDLVLTRRYDGPELKLAAVLAVPDALHVTLQDLDGHGPASTTDTQARVVAVIGVAAVLAQATIGVAQVAIAHDLGYVPTEVRLLPTSAGQVWQSAAPDPTNIYLTGDAAGRTVIPSVR
ncbi:MAG: hypothetical protein ACYDGR_03630 [Candidatus Dormibacteria bacterium]